MAKVATAATGSRGTGYRANGFVVVDIVLILALIGKWS
jgi:hypothetical protein